MTPETPSLNDVLPNTTPAEMPQLPITYAGFWKRVFAFILDYIVMLLLVILFSFGMGMMMAHNGVDVETEDAMVLFDALMQMVVLLVGWLYCALWESSRRQATLGKLLVGIQVTDLAGQRISFLRATGRHFGKYISFVLFGLGFLMIAFTRRKQGLHDLMAGCLVINHPN